ncbi:alpha/beta hydrolase [Bradyrhizobium sp. 61]|uniref:alpha/beta hydrolase n=1 Tax=unclassified Bradyrhizobium TaxID=2631580 RepID=UPI001FFB1413|nr:MULTISPECIES: alpha/beta hydrolase [unclassified Bradyrhizobium]MCK1274717.1 alpha/beta hydrolase [Bradyrhizobium sp. 61]MCK1441711.1 alpha/beta hydrolase [Bradyrhizobium sp. 48]MCK1465253.1 alpha/beta hydrolase [Bradyrhizobium sp. 2]
MDEIAATRVRRIELDRAFSHLAGLAASADLSGVSDPLQQFVAVIRALMPRYGDVGQAPSLDGVTVAPVNAGGVAAEWVIARNVDPAHRIVYTHGGGWVGGSPRDYRAVTATLARLSGAAVLVVDYRLAPEHRFPAALEDCVSAVRWAALNGPDREWDKGNSGTPTHLSLVGDSAGANLAAATCLELAAKGERLPDRLVLIAGTLDNLSPAERVGIDDQIATAESLAAATATYLRPNDNPADYRISPVNAPRELLAKLPPTLLQASAIEALAYDSRKFAVRLDEAGVRTNLSIWPELPHVWHAFLGLFPEATEALQEIADFVSMPG